MIKQNKIIYFFYSLLLIGAFTVIGCSYVFKDKDDKELSSGTTKGFNHNIHTDKGVACKNCHVKIFKSSSAGMPDERLCVFCHQTVYDNQPVGEIYNRGKWQLSHEIERAKYKEINMSHQKHLSMGVECKECHDNIAYSKMVAIEHIPIKETCYKCHSEWNMADKCNICHKEIRYDLPPSSHVGNFKRTRGQLYRDESIQPDKSLSTIPSCKRCHSNDYCVNCHQNEPPENHNNQWRLRGHGISAGINRNDCNTCHKTDFCRRCHESTKPKSHIASNWGNPSNQHCRSCHLPLTLTTCTVCHNGTPSHFEAPPGSHTPGWGNPVNKHCINCHVEDSTCSVCHNGTPSHREVEPASHNAQWSSPKHNHCLRCHVPISVSRRCGECHNSTSGHFSEAPPVPESLPHVRNLSCRTCHTSGGPLLTHADNGLECRICHK